MKQYIGIKLINAQPMTRYDFEMKHSRDCGGDIHGDGYEVEYDGGYKAWSPKATFEAAYFPMLESDGSKITPAMIAAFRGKVTDSKLDEKTTHVCAKTLTGFVQHEVSSCVDPKNYDHKIGVEIGIERIDNTLWKCLGFVLQWAKNGLSNSMTVSE